MDIEELKELDSYRDLDLIDDVATEVFGTAFIGRHSSAYKVELTLWGEQPPEKFVEYVEKLGVHPDKILVKAMMHPPEFKIKGYLVDIGV